MRKTPFYNFIPSKSQEEYERSNNICHIVTSQMVETRDDGHHRIESNIQWTIVKAIKHHNVQNYVVMLSERDVRDNIYSYWLTQKINIVETFGVGNINLLCLKDRTRIATSLKKEDGYYHISLGAFRDNGGSYIEVGDTIMMYYDKVCDALCFNVVKTSSVITASTSSHTTGGQAII